MERRNYTGKAAEILAVAERHMRSGGYDSVSFRDIAAEVGIKSASVHYHFPQKTDLGEAVVHHYMDRLLAGLGPAGDPAETVATRIGRLTAIYRAAVTEEGLVCLCCVLGGETLDLPPPVAEAVRLFFVSILKWTERALDGDRRGSFHGRPSAAQIVASLQGAMILALATKDVSLFTDTTDRVLAQVRAAAA